MGQLEAPQSQPDVRCLSMVAHHSPGKGQKLVERWIRDGPLYQVPSKNQCGRTTVTTVDEMVYTQRPNARFGDVGNTRRIGVFRRVPECMQYPPLGLEDHRAFSAMKTVDGLRQVLEAPVAAVHWALS